MSWRVSQGCSAVTPHWSLPVIRLAGRAFCTRSKELMWAALLLFNKPFKCELNPPRVLPSGMDFILTRDSAITNILFHTKIGQLFILYFFVQQQLRTIIINCILGVLDAKVFNSQTMFSTEYHRQFSLYKSILRSI